MKNDLPPGHSSVPKASTLVYGLGSTGLSVARYLTRNGKAALYVDSRESPPGAQELHRIDPNAEVVTGDLPTSLLHGISRVIVSPGIERKDAFLEAARQASIDVVSDIEVFMQSANADVLAITGSNGKSTVTSLVALMCEAHGVAALAGGNLGRPALDLLDEQTPELFVLELSSFQLQRTHELPLKVAALLNVTPDHLDWHTDEAEYRRAKFRIFAEAASIVINRDDPTLLRELPIGVPYITFGLGTPDEGHYGVITRNGADFLARGDTPLIACDEIALVGLHNRANVLAAMAIGELAGLDVSASLRVVAEFRGLPHRMQFVREIDGVTFINDSKATNVAAAIASVNSLPGRVVLLAGGQGKGGDFRELADAVCERVSTAIVYGEDADPLASAFAGKSDVVSACDLARAVQLATSIARRGDTVLLAPACASFDQFESYVRRGEVFTDLVGEIGL